MGFGVFLALCGYVSLFRPASLLIHYLWLFPVHLVLRKRIDPPVRTVKEFDGVHHFHRQVMFLNAELELQDTARIACSENFSVRIGDVLHLTFQYPQRHLRLGNIVDSSAAAAPF